MLLRYHEMLMIECDGCQTIQYIYGVETENGKRYCKECFENLLEEAEIVDEEDTL